MQMYVAGEWCGAAREEEVRARTTATSSTPSRWRARTTPSAALAAAEEGARAMRALTPWSAARSCGMPLTSSTRRSLDELARTIALEVGKPLLEATKRQRAFPISSG